MCYTCVITRLLCLSALLVAMSTTVGLPLAAEGAVTTAIPTTQFLNSIGIDSTFPDRGQPLAKTIEMVKYAGFRWVRGGIEGLTARGPTTVADLPRPAPANRRPV